MKKIIIIALLVTACAFAQAEIDWWVFDGGGGVRQISAGDTLWASISQPLIGFANGGAAQVSAGYLYGVTSLVGIEEVKPEQEEDGKPVERPYVFGINSVSPNPFNPTCAIEIEIEHGEPVTFEVYDMLGRLVERPIENQIMTPGRYKLTWGGDLPSGTYFARLSSGGDSAIKRLVYLK